MGTKELRRAALDVRGNESKALIECRLAVFVEMLRALKLTPKLEDKPEAKPELKPEVNPGREPLDSLRVAVNETFDTNPCMS
jgi:hypothetical protein